MRNPAMKYPFCHTFSPSGISTKFHGGSLSVEWALIKKVKETKNYMCIYGQRGLPMLLPKNQLDHAQLASLKALLELHLQTNARIKDWPTNIERS